MKNKLTNREREIAELLAWGASKKEISEHLFISVRTVENHTRNIFEKTQCKSVNELSAWWFCSTYHISMNFSPRKTMLSLLVFMLISLMQLFGITDDALKPTQTARTARTVRTQNVRRAGRKNESELTLIA